MNKRITGHSRRQFIKRAALTAGGMLATGPFIVRGQNLNSQINLAQIGCSGKGFGDAICNFHGGANLVALCDVNERALMGLKQYLPRAVTYADYRELFDKEKSIDVVNVSTPDHMHAVIAATAIKLGKHVYCQKPLTHDVAEARHLRELSRQYKVVTQMGNQGSASDSLRRGVELVQGGLIGPVHTAHVWTNRPIWPQGYDRPAGSDPITAGLSWDLWLGTAPTRPFKMTWPGGEQPGKATHFYLGGTEVYQPFNWRGWVDFGTGALGDMACHTVNWPFRSLKLGYPTEIEATASAPLGEMYPAASRIRFEFPAREGMPAVTLHWSDGGNVPPPEVTADIVSLFGRVSPSGCVMVGEKGMIFSPDDGDQELRTFVKLKGDATFVGTENHDAAKAIPQTIPRNAFQATPGPTSPSDERHHKEWLQACRDNKPAAPYSNFEIAAYLTEIILLGCVALRAGKKLEWDGPGMKAKNAPETAAIVTRTYRKGWSM